jgi:hypothetical protein
MMTRVQGWFTGKDATPERTLEAPFCSRDAVADWRRRQAARSRPGTCPMPNTKQREPTPRRKAIGICKVFPDPVAPYLVIPIRMSNPHIRMFDIDAINPARIREIKGRLGQVVLQGASPRE